MCFTAIIWFSLSVIGGIFMLAMQQIYPLMLFLLIALTMNIPIMLGVFIYYAWKDKRQLLDLLSAHEIAPEAIS